MPKLYDLAHCRAGDKGDTSILSLIAYRAESYELLATRVPAYRLTHSPRQLHMIANTLLAAA